MLSGGELPALVLLDAVARLQPGVLGEPSHQRDSFSDGLLDGPQYSRPEVLDAPQRAAAVPRCCCRATMPRSRAGAASRLLRITAQRRPDLIAQARADRAGSTPPTRRFLRTLGL